MRAEHTRELLAPREDVWGFLAEPYHMADWWPGVTAVRPDRRGFAAGARWEVVGPAQPTLLRKAHAVGLLVIREIDLHERISWYLTAERLHVDLRLGVLAPDRTRATLAVEGPWRPEVLGRPRALPREALWRLHELCQTAASL